MFMGKYDDIIELEHHRSTKHPHMSIHDRAAQFAPFEALTGHKEQIAQAAEEDTLRREMIETEDIDDI